MTPECPCTKTERVEGYRPKGQRKLGDYFPGMGIPEYGKETCLECGLEMVEMWHIAPDIHLCSYCGAEYGLAPDV